MADRLVLKRRAGDLRRNQTPAERALWAHLRMRNMAGVRFLRQHVIGDYIIDFDAPSLRLAIELDGGQHYDPHKVRYDVRRTARLTVLDITVLRYTSLDVSQRLEEVLSDIERVVSRLKDHPPAAARRPPSSGRGEFHLVCAARSPEVRSEANAREARLRGTALNAVEATFPRRCAASPSCGRG